MTPNLTLVAINIINKDNVIINTNYFIYINTRKDYFRITR